MLRLIMALGCYAFMATSFSFAQELTLPGLEKFLGNYGVSCQEMTLTKILLKDEIYSKLVVLPFETSRCEKFLSPSTISSIIEPVLKEIVFANADINQGPVVDDEKVRQLEDERFMKAGKTVQENTRSMADACLSSAAGREKNQTILCYYGGPKSESSIAFKTIFKAMLDNALPDLEPVCSSEPLTLKSASDNIFKSILSSHSVMTWNDLKTTLITDGFFCVEDRCIRNVMGLVLPGTASLREQLQLNPKAYFLLLPRYLTVYRGDWRVIGPPYNGCFVDNDGKKSGHFCDGPSNGVSKGICLAKEDFHTWYGFSMMLNYASSAFGHN